MTGLQAWLPKDGEPFYGIARASLLPDGWLRPRPVVYGWKVALRRWLRGEP